MVQNETSFLQLLPPIVVAGLLIYAAYVFVTRFVIPSRNLRTSLSKIANTVRSMSDGDEMIRKSGVARVFQNTTMEKTWHDFSKTLHTQTTIVNGVARQSRSRITVPAAHFFSVSAVIDRPLGVDYFKHLPGILTGVGIIGTFTGLLFGLSSFDATNADSMSRSVGMLLAGVRDAFYASAAAITLAIAITHWEKSLYRQCLTALDDLVEAVNSLFEAGVGEEYLANLVRNANANTDQAKSLRDELIQSMVPVIKQMEMVQSQQTSNLGSILEQALTEANRRLAVQIENALTRQVKGPIDELTKRLDNRFSHQNGSTEDMARRVIRARQSERPLAENNTEGLS